MASVLSMPLTLLLGLQAATKSPAANRIGNYRREVLGIADMAMFNFGEFRFVQHGPYRHIAAGTDGIDGSILISSMRKRFIPKHATPPSWGKAQYSSNSPGSQCLLADIFIEVCAGRLAAVRFVASKLGMVHGDAQRTAACYRFCPATYACTSQSAEVSRWLEKCSRHQAPTALRIPLVASLADDLVGEVAELLAGSECTT